MNVSVRLRVLRNETNRLTCSSHWPALKVMSGFDAMVVSDDVVERCGNQR